MNYQNRQKRRIETFRIVAIYSLFGLAWIYGSDTVLSWLVHDSAVMAKIEVIKGSLFILFTAILLYILINRFVRQLISAESARLESLSRCQTIFNATNEAILVHDAQSGLILDMNDRMLEIYGYTREEALSVEIGNLSEGSPPYTQTDAAEKVRRALLEGPQVFEWHSRKKNGELFWSEVSLRRIMIQEVDRVLAVVRDISERKRLDDALRMKEQRHQIILDSAIDGFWVVSLDGRLLEVNDAYCQLSGHSKQELLTMTIADFDVNEATADSEAHNKKIMEQGEDRFVAQHRRKDGTVFDVEVSAKFIPVDGGLIVGFIRDITERKQTEEALQESNNRVMSLVNRVPGHIAFVNAETLQYEYVNEAFEKSFGLPRGKIIGSHIKEIIGESNYQFALKYIKEVKSGKSASYENTFELTSGKRWIQVNYSPMIDSNGVVVSIVVHSFDITSIKEHEKEQLKIDKLESLGILAGGIAHDFNNVLTAILGNISLAQMFIDDSHKSYKPLVGAEKASMRASELARQLLTFARGGEPVKKVVSLQHIAHETVSLVLSGSNVKGVVDIPDSIHAIGADEGQLSQVFHNLIINATHAMPSGGLLTIIARNETILDNSVMSLPAGPYICLTFGDEGCGIAEDDLKKIFDPYFTTKLSGSGLGLASVHSIITKHGGHIGARSVPGKGTTFTIYLPSIGETYTEYQSESPVQTYTNKKGGSILIMDDEEMIRELASRMLSELGYQVTTCENGEEAITLYKEAIGQEKPFAAVIMDLTIPGGMGGKEAAQKILSFDAKAKMIVSSGYSSDPILANYKTYGFVGAVAKPYRVSELGQMLITLAS